jgi:hypothetical protein
MEEQKEIQRLFREQQQKFTYYLIALCVTAIGYSVYTTTGSPLKISMIPLGLAVISWGLSIYCGLTWLGYSLDILFAGNTYFDIIQGLDPVIGNHPKNIQYGTKILKKKMDKKSNSTGRIASWQVRLFYLGMILFIIWHVYEMYLKSTNSSLVIH